MNDKQKHRIAEAPTSCQGILERAYRGHSRTTAIKAFCLQCTGYVRADVAGCTALGCPLWPYRPTYKAGEAEDGDEDVATSTENAVPGL